MSSAAQNLNVEDAAHSKPLSLGVEVVIQLAVVRMEPTTNATHPPDYAVCLLEEALSQEMLARCSYCSEYCCFETNNWTVSAGWRGPVARKINAEEAWKDAAPHIYSLDQLYFVELTSPKFSLLRDSKHLGMDGEAVKHEHFANWKAEITAVLNHIDKELGVSKVDECGVESLLYAPRSAQLKARISSDEPLSLQTMKNVATMSQACQRQLDTIQSVNSINHTVSSVDYTDEGHPPDHDGWQTSQIEDSKDSQSFDVDWSITQLQLAEHVRALPTSLYKLDGNLPLTIETSAVTFSQQASTLDAKKVLCWIDVATKMLQRSHTLPQGYICRATAPAGEWRSAQFTASRFLRMLQCKSSTIKHCMHRGSGGKARAAVLREKLEIAEAATTFEMLTAELMVWVAEQAVEDDDVFRIGEMVNGKLKAGRYGLFDDQYLEKVESIGL